MVLVVENGRKSRAVIVFIYPVEYTAKVQILGIGLAEDDILKDPNWNGYVVIGLLTMPQSS